MNIIQLIYLCVLNFRIKRFSGDMSYFPISWCKHFLIEKNKEIKRPLDLSNKFLQNTKAEQTFAGQHSVIFLPLAMNIISANNVNNKVKTSLHKAMTRI